MVRGLGRQIHWFNRLWNKMRERVPWWGSFILLSAAGEGSRQLSSRRQASPHIWIILLTSNSYLHLVIKKMWRCWPNGKRIEQWDGIVQWFVSRLGILDMQGLKFKKLVSFKKYLLLLFKHNSLPLGPIGAFIFLAPWWIKQRIIR